MPIIRTLAERLARQSSIRRRLPARFARTEILVSPDSQLKYLKPGAAAFDLELLRVIDTHVREDSIVWDIGANIGVFALAAASVATRGATLAVEADLWLAQLMHRSLRLRGNRQLRLSILPAAIADRNGTATFNIALRGRASNSLASIGGHSMAGGVREQVMVPTLTLDTLLDHVAAPTFVKMDIEGAEALALRGAERLLRDVRPTLYVEVGAAANDEVTQLLLAQRYRLYDGAATAPSPQLARCAFNTLAVPEP